MDGYTKEDVLRLVENEDVEFIRLQFTDIFGVLKNVAITASQLKRALDNQYMFDGSAIEGFAGREEADWYLHPALDTLEIFPWRPQQGKVARLICNVHCPDGKPSQGDSRYILQKVLQEVKELGYTFIVGPECEFFLFQTDESGLPVTETSDKAGYFDLGPVDLGENVRRDIVLNLEDMGFTIEASHHELAPGQHEIAVGCEEALRAADNIMTFKFTVKSIARRHGMHATFMPKPVHGIHGSGMHIHMSLYRDGKNVFADENGESGLSETACHFMAGLMKHRKGLTLITNPLVNSYKRLVPELESAWSNGNRHTLIRVPQTRDGNSRIELRSPDACCNPYLTLALCLAAGMEGIRSGLEVPAGMAGNMLPATLGEAIVEFERDELVRQVLGEHIAKAYVREKKAEWEEYQARVTDWEIEQYLLKY